MLGWLVRYGDMNVIYGVVRDIPWLLEPNGGGSKKDGVLIQAKELAGGVLVEEEESAQQRTRKEMKVYISVIYSVGYRE